MRRGGATFLVLVLLAGGCALPSDLARARAEVRASLPASRTPEQAAGYAEFVGALHVHSFVSHDCRGTREELVSGAREASLDFVALTDHYSEAIDRSPRGTLKGVLFIPGAEISRDGGSILAFGLREWFPIKGRGRDEILREIEARGALPFIGHLERRSPDAEPGLFRGAGIVNLHATLRDGLRGFAGVGFALAFFDAGLFPVEGLRYLPLVRRPDATLEAYDRLACAAPGRPFTAIAESDAHAKIRWGPLVLDPYTAVFRLVRTHVLARAGDERGILEALGAGRAFVAFDALADSRGFRFRARSGNRLAFPGEALPLGPDTWLEVSAPARAHVRFFRDGTLAAEASGAEAALPVGCPGLWRVELSLPVRGRERPWIFSNPVRVEAGPYTPAGLERSR